MEIHTLLELLDEVVDDLLEGVCVDGENVFILLDLVQEILGDLEHGSY